MSSRYKQFDRSRLNTFPLVERNHDLNLSALLPLSNTGKTEEVFSKIAECIISAKAKGSAVVLMMGAHVLRSGVQRYIIDLMEKGFLSCIAINGAGVIHDFEFALIGATTESVAHYIRDGRFGMWQETSRINDIITMASEKGLGLGEAVGKVIEEEQFPHNDISVLAAGYRLGIPITVHVGVGQDIIHELPNCNGAALGDTSYRDFLIFTKILEKLQAGVVMNFGTAVMGPEVYLKGLSMVRNIAKQENRQINEFTSLVCDLVELPKKYSSEPCKKDSRYYFRPWKTILVRTVADGGESYYFRGKHENTIPQLWSALNNMENMDDPSVIENLGTSFFNSGDYIKAREYYGKLPITLDNIKLCLSTYLPLRDISGMLEVKDDILSKTPVVAHAQINSIFNEFMEQAYWASLEEFDEQYKRNIKYLKQLDETLFEKYEFGDDFETIERNPAADFEYFKGADSIFKKQSNGWVKVFPVQGAGQLKRDFLGNSQNIISRCTSIEDLLELIDVVSTDEPEFYKYEYKVIIEFKLLEKAMAVCDLASLVNCDFVIKFIDENNLEEQVRDLLCRKRSFFPSLFVDPAVRNKDFFSQHLSPLLEDCEGKIFQDIEKLNQQLSGYYPKDFYRKLASKIAGNEKLRILFKTSRYTTFLQYSVRDMAEGFRKLGHETFIEIEEEHCGVGIRSDLGLKNICDFCPDIIFSIDHMRFEMPRLTRNIPFVTWVQDAMERILKLSDPEAVGDLDFIFSTSSLMMTQINANPVYENCSTSLLPMPLNPSMYYPLKDCEKKYPVSYVSHLVMPKPCIAAYSDSPDCTLSSMELLCRYYIKFTNTFSLDKLTYFYNGGVYIKTREVLSLFSDYFEKYTISQDGEKWFAAHHRKLLLMAIRVRIPLFLAENNISLSLFGNGWKEHPKLTHLAMGPVKNGPDLNRIINETAINLNINPVMSFHNKVPEVAGAGAFFLTRRIRRYDQMSLDLFFKENKEVVYFDSNEDLLNKIQYYLADEQARDEIAERAREKVLAEFTCEKSAIKVINSIFDRIQQN
jgi:hypothetical protein